MSGRLHIVDDDNLSGYKIYEEVRRDYSTTRGVSKFVTVLRKHGAVFADIGRANDYVTTYNERIDQT